VAKMGKLRATRGFKAGRHHGPTLQQKQRLAPWRGASRIDSLLGAHKLGLLHKLLIQSERARTSPDDLGRDNGHMAPLA
jgi:hypothetical protein